MSLGTIIGIVVAGVILFTLPKIMPPPSVQAHSQPVADHSHVKIEGTSLPAGIGINADLWKDHSLDKYGVSGYAPLHTHEADNYIHIETTERRGYTLQDFLNIWGVQYKSVKLYHVYDPNVFGSVHEDEIGTPLRYTFQDNDHLKLELTQ